MKFMITGGAGFIGSAVVRMALDRGLEVVNIDALTYAANLNNLAGYQSRQGYTFIHANICDGDAIARALAQHQPDAILHLAAETHVDRSIHGPDAFISSNINGTYSLLTQTRRYFDGLTGARKDSFRFLHVSTDEVFGSLGPEGAFTETSPYRPNSPYSASKASADMLVRAWGQTFGLPVLISNCSNNYGPFQFPEKLIPVVILAALEGRPIPVYGAGLNIRDWLYVDDHADALLQLVSKGRIGETYLVGARCERRNIDLVRSICAILDALAPAPHPYEDLIRFVEDRPGHDARYGIDPSRIEQELGWHARTGFEEGMRQTINWYLNNRPWWTALVAKHKQASRDTVSGT
jgi:dTDP-glucose 4,6-dehydratase